MEGALGYCLEATEQKERSKMHAGKRDMSEVCPFVQDMAVIDSQRRRLLELKENFENMQSKIFTLQMITLRLQTAKGYL